MLRQSDALEVAAAWLLGVVLYPGLAFGVALTLVGEWLFSTSNPLFTRRVYRARSRPRHSLQPIYDTLKLAARRPSTQAITFHVSRFTFHTWDVPQFLAPTLALALLPLPASPVTSVIGPVGDVFVVLALLAVQPVFAALARLRDGDLTISLEGAHYIGRLLTGLFPALVALAALIESLGGRSLLLTDLLTAPETGAQALVRLLSGAALLVALPWWLDPRGAANTRSAGEYMGALMQRSALAAFWSVLVLPAPGDLAWALFVTIAGALFAYVAIRALQARAARAPRQSDATRLAWTTTLPVAALSLAAAFLL